MRNSPRQSVLATHRERGGTPALPGHGLDGLRLLEADLPLASGGVKEEPVGWTRVRDTTT